MSRTGIWQDQNQELGAKKHDQRKKKPSNRKSPNLGHVQCHENRRAAVSVRGPNYKPILNSSLFPTGQPATLISDPVPISLLSWQLLSHHSPVPVAGSWAPIRVRGCLWSRIKVGCTVWWPSYCYTGNTATPARRLRPSQLRNIRAAFAHKTASLVSHREMFVCLKTNTESWSWLQTLWYTTRWEKTTHIIKCLPKSHSNAWTLVPPLYSLQIKVLPTSATKVELLTAKPSPIQLTGGFLTECTLQDMMGRST